jgi:hypothetical protein
VNERDLEAEQPDPRLLVDQLDAGRTKPVELPGQVGNRERDVVHTRPALGEETPDGRLGTERLEQLDPRIADPERRRLDTLLRHHGTVLDGRAEQFPVRLDRDVEAVDRDAEVMDP